MSGKQRQFQRPAVVRLPQISPLQVSVRRRPLIISPDKQLPLTEHMPTTRRALPSYPRSEQRLPLTEHIPTLPDAHATGTDTHLPGVACDAGDDYATNPRLHAN